MNENTYNTKGRISIYGFNGRILETKLYYSRQGRKEIMAKWKSDWEDRASYFQVFPFAQYPEEPKEVKKKFIKIPIIKEKPRLQRPLANYTNLKSKYGIADDMK